MSASWTCARCGSPAERLIGNCAIEADLGTGPRVIAGFENHGGRTYLGDGERPLGRVLAGHGNNGRDGFEGVHSRNVIGTYLHGPLLPKNVWLADRLIELALGLELEPLPGDALEDAAHASARARRRRRPEQPLAPVPTTRSTSATEVTPSRILSSPSSRRVRMPSPRAAARMLVGRAVLEDQAPDRVAHRHHLVDARCGRGSRCRAQRTQPCGSRP